jgi:hypothetical protein
MKIPAGSKCGNKKSAFVSDTHFGIASVKCQSLECGRNFCICCDANNQPVLMIVAMQDPERWQSG